MPAEPADAALAAGVLVVDSPVHGTIRFPLRAGVTTVGSALTSDLVLGDPSIAGTHFRIHAGAPLRLEAVDQPVAFGQADLAAPGSTRPLLQATAFLVGSVPMRIEVAPALPLPAEPVAKPAANPAWHRIAAGIALLALAGSAAYAFTGRAPVPAEALAAAARPVPGLEHPAPLTLAALQAHLDERQLGLVRVEVLPDGSYRATGAVSPAEAPAWREVARWFDDEAGGMAVLVDKVAVANAAPPLAVQSAWLGPRPYVIDGSGQKLFTGAVLANGWVIEGIEAGRVTMHRQGQRLAVRF